MTQVMVKGANTAVHAAAVRVVLEWRPGPGTPDMDASALLLGADQKVGGDHDFVFYNQQRHPSGSVTHTGKRVVNGVAADEVRVDLAAVPATVATVVISASADGGTVSQVPGLVLRVFDDADGRALIEFPIHGATTETAFVLGELYRRGGQWKFRAVGQGYDTGLAGLATDYGIEVDDDDTGAAPPPPAPAPPPAFGPGPGSGPGSGPAPGPGPAPGYGPAGPLPPAPAPPAPVPSAPVAATPPAAVPPPAPVPYSPPSPPPSPLPSPSPAPDASVPHSPAPPAYAGLEPTALLPAADVTGSTGATSSTPPPPGPPVAPVPGVIPPPPSASGGHNAPPPVTPAASMPPAAPVAPAAHATPAAPVAPGVPATPGAGAPPAPAGARTPPGVLAMPPGGAHVPPPVPVPGGTPPPQHMSPHVPPHQVPAQHVPPHGPVPPVPHPAADPGAATQLVAPPVPGVPGPAPVTELLNDPPQGPQFQRR